MRVWVTTAGLFGLCAIAMGAWGAHGLAGDPQAQAWVERASQYQLFHALALLAAAWLADSSRRNPLAAHAAAAAFVLGVLLFCGSLYARALTGGDIPFPMATPAGGMALMVGWLLIFVAGLRK